MEKKTFLAITPFFIISSILLFINGGCRYDHQDLLPSSCDTAIVTFSGSVKPILSAYCIYCHTGFNASNGIKLDDYFSVKMEIPNGKLSGTINHSPGFSPMPLGGNKLKDCDISKIRKWINEGALNN